MNPLPPNADELVSAYLDGEAAPDEIALVESTPELRARVETLRSLSGMINQPSAAPADTKSAHLSAAMGLFDELYGAQDVQAAATDPIPQTDAPTGSHLRAVQDPPPAQVAPATAATSPGVKPAIASLDDARERRKRRFSPMVIAATIAAAGLMLFAVFSLAGPRADDSAMTESAPSAASAADEPTGGLSDFVDADEEAAMVEEEAMSDEMQEGLDQAARSEDLQGGEVSAAAPEVELAGPADDAAMDDDESANDSAMDDDESANDSAMDADDAAMEDDESADDASGDAVDGAVSIEPFFFGTFDDDTELRSNITVIPLELLDERVDLDGLFPSCRDSLPQLADVDGPTLIGQATIDGTLHELHLRTTATGQQVFVVALPSCEVVSDVVLG